MSKQQTHSRRPLLSIFLLGFCLSLVSPSGFAGTGKVCPIHTNVELNEDTEECPKCKEEKEEKEEEVKSKHATPPPSEDAPEDSQPIFITPAQPQCTDHSGDMVDLPLSAISMTPMKQQLSHIHMLQASTERKMKELRELMGRPDSSPQEEPSSSAPPLEGASASAVVANPASTGASNTMFVPSIPSTQNHILTTFATLMRANSFSYERGRTKPIRGSMASGYLKTTKPKNLSEFQLSAHGLIPQEPGQTLSSILGEDSHVIVQVISSDDTIALFYIDPTGPESAEVQSDSCEGGVLPTISLHALFNQMVTENEGMQIHYFSYSPAILSML